MTLYELRAHLVECFEPDVRIVGNTTQREIVQAIDDARAALFEALNLADALGGYVAANNPYAKVRIRLARVDELRRGFAPSRGTGR